MSKQEFLKQLAFRLHHLSVEERDDIINYYDELIEDKKDREHLSEEAIINELGSLDEIARRVAPKNKEVVIHYEEESKKVEKGPNEAKDTKLIMSIISIPIGIVVGLILLSIGISIVMISISLVATGVVCLGLGITSFATNYLTAIYEISVAFMLFGVALMVIPALGKAFNTLIKWVKQMFSKYLLPAKEEK